MGPTRTFVLRKCGSGRWGCPLCTCVSRRNVVCRSCGALADLFPWELYASTVGMTVPCMVCSLGCSTNCGGDHACPRIAHNLAVAVKGVVHRSFEDYAKTTESLPAHFVMRDTGHLVVVQAHAACGVPQRVTVTNHVRGWHVFVIKSKMFGGSELVQRALVNGDVGGGTVVRDVWPVVDPTSIVCATLVSVRRTDPEWAPQMLSAVASSACARRRWSFVFDSTPSTAGDTPPTCQVSPIRLFHGSSGARAARTACAHEGGVTCLVCQRHHTSLARYVAVCAPELSQHAGV